MSNAFISGVLASATFLSDFSLSAIKQKYGVIDNVDEFIETQKESLRTSLLAMGLEGKHLDLLYAFDDYHMISDTVMLDHIKAYQGSEAGMAYRDAFCELYAHFDLTRPLDFELKFDQELMRIMHPFLNRFVGVDGIIAHVYFTLIELKNVGIVLKAQHYNINPESRLRYHEF